MAFEMVSKIVARSLTMHFHKLSWILCLCHWNSFTLNGFMVQRQICYRWAKTKQDQNKYDYVKYEYKAPL